MGRRGEVHVYTDVCPLGADSINIGFVPGHHAFVMHRRHQHPPAARVSLYRPAAYAATPRSSRPTRARGPLTLVLCCAASAPAGPTARRCHVNTRRYTSKPSCARPVGCLGAVHQERRRHARAKQCHPLRLRRRPDGGPGSTTSPQLLSVQARRRACACCRRRARRYWSQVVGT